MIVGERGAALSRYRAMPSRKAGAPARDLYPLDDVPEVCPFCGQRIDKRSTDQIEHHRKAPHLPFSGAGKKSRKRRWQAPPR
jgi:hypothetical protein